MKNKNRIIIRLENRKESMTKIKSLPFLPAAPRTAVSRRRDPNRDLCCEGFVITEENALNCSVIPRDVPAPEIPGLHWR